jgi:zinc protease
MISGARMRRLTSLVALVLVALFATAPALAQPKPQPGFPQDRYTDFAPDLAVRYGQLDNGVRYAIQRWQQPKDEVSIRVRFAAGSLVEAENQLGLMHFLEHMAFNGSENVPENDFDRMLAREGLAFGPDTNAYTSWDETVYQLDMPHGDKLPLGLMLMRETASRLTLAPDSIDRERGVIAAEERARDNPGMRQFRAWMAHTFPGTRMVDRNPIGSMDVVRTAPRERFQELYRSFYTPERTFVVVVGDIDPAIAEVEIRKAFADWQAPASAGPDPDFGTLQGNAGRITLYADAQLPVSASMTVTRPFVELPDTSETRRTFLLRGLATGILNTRLERIAQRPDAPFISASASSGDWFRSGSVVQLEAMARDDSGWQSALAAADLELRRMLAHGVDADEVRIALANTREAYARAASQSAARRSRSIAEGLIGAFGNDSVYTDDAADLAWFDRIAPTITAEAVSAALPPVWGTSTPALFLTTNAPVAGGIDAVQGAYAAARAAPVEAAAALVTRPWDYTAFGEPGRVVATQTVPDLGVTNIRFANNVRLVVRPSDFEPGRVRVALRFGEGALALPSDRPGLGFAISSAFTAGGLGRFDQDELARTLAGRTVSTGFGVGEDAFQFGGQTTPTDLALQMQVFAAYLTDPGWRPDGLIRLKAQKDAIYRQVSSTPGAVWGAFGDPLLRSGNQRFAFPTPAQFDALTLDAARAPLDLARRRGAIEVVITGDTTVEAATAAVASTFGALPRRASRPARHRSAERVVFTPGRGTDTLFHDGRADQSLALVYWPMRDYGDGAEARALRVLEQVLQLRLTEVIRESEGATYSPGTDWSPSTTYPGFGLIGAVMELEPKDVDRMQAKVEEIAAGLAAGNIDQDLFVRARTPLIADFDETRTNNPWWMTWLSGSSFRPERLGIIRNGRQHYEQVTLEQVKALAAQYLQPGKARLIRVLPRPAAAAAAPDAAPAAAPAGQ